MSLEFIASNGWERVKIPSVSKCVFVQSGVMLPHGLETEAPEGQVFACSYDESNFAGVGETLREAFDSCNLAFARDVVGKRIDSYFIWLHPRYTLVNGAELLS